MSGAAAKTPPLLIRRRHPWRDTVEGILSALVLVLIIRYFAFEVFKIPTGSMAPTLLGQHRDLICPNCNYPYAVDGGGGVEVIHRDARCPNCGFVIPAKEVNAHFCSCFPSWPQRYFSNGGNRVIVNKFLGHVRPVHRWDVVVFKWPFTQVVCQNPDCRYIDKVPQGEQLPTQCLSCGSTRLSFEQLDFIKRLVGLPGEKLTIRHGDIYIDGVLARKPDSVQEAVWQHVYDSAYPPREPVTGYAARWRADQGSYEETDGRLILLPGRTPALLRYNQAIQDFTAYNRLNPRQVPSPVGDLRWIVKVKLDAPGLLRLGVDEDESHYCAVVRFGQAAGRTCLLNGDRSLSQSDFTAPVGQEVEVSFANADDRLELRVAGQLILACDVNVPFGEAPEEAGSNGAWIGSTTPASISRIQLQRDIYYIQRAEGVTSRPTYEIPPSGYFVMGDNTQNSSDSRYWGSFPQSNVIGLGSVVWWPLNQVRAVR